MSVSGTPRRKRTKLHWLQRNLPEGLLVTAGWLTERGYSTSLRTQYVAAGWLEQPTRGVFRRPRGALRWEQVVISLQTLLECQVVIGGRTALELQGYARWLSPRLREIHLYGPEPRPPWLDKLPLPVSIVYHRSHQLFRDNCANTIPISSSDYGGKAAAPRVDLAVRPWDHQDWALTLSTPELALLELLDTIPDGESFHEADRVMEGLFDLDPQRLQRLLEDCRSVKVKRLFFFFADRHDPAWLARIDRACIDLGKGKRELARSGRLDPAYRITVPEDLVAVQ